MCTGFFLAVLMGKVIEIEEHKTPEIGVLECRDVCIRALCMLLIRACTHPTGVCLNPQPALQFDPVAASSHFGPADPFFPVFIV